MISVAGLGKAFGGQTLFSGVSFRVNPGERHGLVGANGSGKTTLLNILSGDAEAGEGSVSMPRRLRLGVLRQDQFLYQDEEILQVTLMGNRELWEAMAEKEEVLSRADADDFDANRFSELEEIVQHHDGYTAEARAGAILEGLGIPSAVHRNPLSTLSGGFRLRVLLAQVLASSPDALLLDEPTNHLDILSIRWLEKFLRDFPGPVIVISHDQRFLDNVVTHILDVDYETILVYPGNYGAFRRAKAAEMERREKEIATREKEIDHHRKFVDRFRAKATKARQAQSKLRLIEKKAEGLVALPRSSRRWPSFRFEQARPSGKEVVRIKGVSKAYGSNRVLEGVDLDVSRGDRLAVMGPNGIGKSTLLKIMAGRLDLDDGSVEWGYETRPGYFAQEHGDHFRSLRRSAEAWVSDACDGQGRGLARKMMGRVLFSDDDAEKPLGALSGGEATRLVFCRLMIRAPNVLLLDEPTNHLDMESIEALVEGLRAFDGTLVFVSHDRWFASRLANRIVELGPDTIRDYRGSYEEYVHFCGDDHLDVDTVVRRAARERSRARSGRSGADRRAGRGPQERGRQRLEDARDRVMARIEKAEARLARLDLRLADPLRYAQSAEGADGDTRTLAARRAALAAEIDGLVAEWERVEAEIEETSRP